MSTITTLNTADTGATSRGVLNTNFTNLNTDKMETSVLDTDVTLAANSDLKVATQKAVKSYVDSATGVVTMETTAGATHALTTTASQVVAVWAKGVVTGISTGANVITLAYNGVSKDTVSLDNCSAGGTGDKRAFSLMYTETPGAATQNVTVTTDTGTLAEVKIMVQKIS